MHSESPMAQMENELRAIKLFGLIVQTCLKESQWGGDWKFCLIALSILADIADSNTTKGNLIKKIFFPNGLYNPKEPIFASA